MTQQESPVQQDAVAPNYVPPLHYTESDRLKARQLLAGTLIQQVLSPLLCDVTNVQISTHVVQELPVSMGLGSDATADIFLYTRTAVEAFIRIDSRPGVS